MKRVVVFFVLAVAVLGSCSNKQKIVGTWADRDGATWIFSADGKLTIKGGKGSRAYDDFETTYSVADKKLQLLGVQYVYQYRAPDKAVEYPMTYDISMSADGKTIILSGGNNSDGYFPGYDPLLTRVSSSNAGAREVDITGTWKGDIQGYDFTLTITKTGWSVSIPGIGHADTGTYMMDGKVGRFTSDNNGQTIGEGEIKDSKTISITLNSNSIAPGNYTLLRQ